MVWYNMFFHGALDRSCILLVPGSLIVIAVNRRRFAVFLDAQETLT